LIRVDKERNEPPGAPQGQTFGVDLETAVLKRAGAKVVRLVGSNFFRRRTIYMRLVDGPKIGIKGVEVVKSS
jgi:hypothetical protein